MKITLLLKLITAIIYTLIASISYAATTTKMEVSGVLRAGLVAQHVQDLSFGTIIQLNPASSSSVSLGRTYRDNGSFSGNIVSQENAILVMNPAPGAIRVYGEEGRFVKYFFNHGGTTRNIILKSSSGKELTAAIELQPGSKQEFLGQAYREGTVWLGGIKGYAQLYVIGKLNIPANTDPGTYSGDFNVTINYE